MSKRFEAWLNKEKALDDLIHKIMNDDHTITMLFHPGDIMALQSLIWICMIKHTFDDDQLEKLVTTSAAFAAVIVKIFPDAERYLVETTEGALAAQNERRKKAGRA